MKYETFKGLIENAKKLYDDAVKRDKRLEDALGNNSVVITDWWGEYIEEIINIIQKEYNDDTDSVSWLFWESVCNDKYQDFVIDGAIYEGNPFNVWMDLEGELSERFAKGFEESVKPQVKKTKKITTKNGFVISEWVYKNLKTVYNFDPEQLEHFTRYNIKVGDRSYILQTSLDNFTLTENNGTGNVGITSLFNETPYFDSMAYNLTGNLTFTS